MRIKDLKKGIRIELKTCDHIESIKTRHEIKQYCHEKFPFKYDFTKRLMPRWYVPYRTKGTFVYFQDEADAILFQLGYKEKT